MSSPGSQPSHSDMTALAELLADVVSTELDLHDVGRAVERTAGRILAVDSVRLVLDHDKSAPEPAGDDPFTEMLPVNDRNGARIGSLVVDGPPDRPLTGDARATAELITSIVATAIEHRRLLERAHLDRVRLTTVNDALPGGIIVRDVDGQLLYTNRWMREFSKRFGNDRIGSGDRDDGPHELVDEQLRPLPDHERPSARAGRGEQFDGVITGLPLADGRVRWLNTSGRPLLDAHGTLLGGLVVVTDVTDRVDFRLRLARSEQLLRDAERIAKIGSWTRDIRTGESLVSDGLRALAGLAPDEPITRELLYEIFHPDDRAAVFEGTFRAFEEGVPYRDRRRVVDAAGAIHVVELEAERFAGPDGEPAGLVGTIRDLTDDLAQEERLSRAERMEMIGRLAGGLAHDFHNLLTVLTGHAELLHDAVDDGPGMDHETRERAFEPFFTTKPLGTGTGLGLATSYGIVTQSGGALTLTSRPGAGTTASVLLPWTDQEPEGWAAPGATRRPSNGPVTILLAEDEDHLRPLLERVLRQRGHRVLTGVDGLDALQVAARDGGPIDLLVTDVSMPRRNGHELATALAAVHPHLQVIFMSGYTENSVVMQGRARRDIDFLAKPFSMSQLTELVDAVIDRAVIDRSAPGPAG